MPGEPIRAKRASEPDEVSFEARRAIVRFGEATYTLRAVSPAVASFLRVPVQVERGGASHLDRIDLSTARARKRYAEAAARKLGLDASAVEAHLVAILALLDDRARKETEDSDRRLFAAPPAPLSEGDRRVALDYLRQPDLLAAIERDLTLLGYVGEPQNKKLAYLVALSRKLPAPLAAILRSSAGSGKSALLDIVTRLAPPEDVVFLSELTPQALYYLERDALRHKLLIVDERAGSERADYPIRTLLSRQTLTLAVTAPDAASGRRKTRLVEVRGPVAYLESTTATVINAENAGRALEIFLDESPEQTRRIQEAQRRRRNGHEERGTEDLLALHRNVQRCLEPFPVTIPFARHLSFPSEHPRHRRDHEKFLRLIEAAALLHQHQREKQDGAVVATLTDYQVAYDLGRPVLALASDILTPQARRVLAYLRNEESMEFTRRDLVRGLAWPPVRVWRALQELLGAEYVMRLPVGADRRHRYQVLEFFQAGEIVSRLLPPEDLARRIVP